MYIYEFNPSFYSVSVNLSIDLYLSLRISILPPLNRNNRDVNGPLEEESK